jgi:AAA domain, putative AbiEii toxin, Type IV TA system
MYIEKLRLENVRTFVGGRSGDDIAFVHAEADFRPRGRSAQKGDERLPRQHLPNVNLLLGDNGSGKSSVLRAIAASAFGPAAKDLLRDGTIVRFGEETARIRAELRLHEQDRADGQDEPDPSQVQVIPSELMLERRGERLEVTFAGKDAKTIWKPVNESQNDAFFVVGYGATRRVERLDTYDSAARIKSRIQRDLRVQGLFEDAFSLIPLGSWLPRLKTENPGRYKQVEHLFEALLKPGGYRFTGETNPAGDYLFDRGGMGVPFHSMSDGYRAFIGWVSDLLYHVCMGAPSGKKLVESRGIILVDEIDLHLHPKWQMQVIATIARTLPNMQFVFTSHSPLVAGSLEWMNIITLRVNSRTNRTRAKRLQESIHGLDADQILLTGFFGLTTTRAASKARQLEGLRHRATLGNDKAKRDYIRALATGTDPSEPGTAEEIPEDPE